MFVNNCYVFDAWPWILKKKMGSSHASWCLGDARNQVITVLTSFWSLWTDLSHFSWGTLPCICYKASATKWSWLQMEINLPLHIDVLVQDCSMSSALAMEILLSCTKPWIYVVHYGLILPFLVCSVFLKFSTSYLCEWPQLVEFS